MANLSGFENAVGYPYTDPSMFKGNSWVNLDAGSIVNSDEEILLQTSPFAKQIGDSLIELPTYNVALLNSDGKSLEGQRIAIMAIGSNCSPQVLMDKFRGKASGTFLVAQSEIDNHAVVHGAFIGAKGTIPATVVPHAGTNTQVTVGFFTPEQAQVLTGTEPNYDVVQSGFKTVISQGTGTVLEHGAALYVSPWGALTMNGTTPIALKDIPSITALPKWNSETAMKAVADITGQTDVEAFYNALPQYEVGHRLNEIFKIQADHAIPARIQGRQVWKATIGTECEKIGQILPAIDYIL